MQDRDIILTVNVVEPELVRAVHMHSQRLGKQLKGLVLVHKPYANQPGRPHDTSGLFEEIICDFDNPDELQRVLKPYTDRILAATCRYEEAMQPFGKIIPFLPNIHTPSEAAMTWSTEKPLMRDRLKNYDRDLVPRYQYMEAADLPRAEELTKDFIYPVIIKPSGLSKALLVTRCNNEQELAKNLAHTFDIITDIYNKEQYPGKPAVLVEEMMQGDIYSVDAYISHDGAISCLPPVKVTTAHAVGLPGFYGYQQVLPSGLSEKETQAAFIASEAAIKALSLSSTTAHIELFHTPEGWKIIEIAARIGGFRDALYREAYGIEHFYNDLSVRMGLAPTMPGKLLRHAAAIKIYAEEEGRIESIEGLDQARKLESIVRLSAHSRPGDEALFITHGGDPVIDGILSNEDPKQLEEDIRRVRELINISVQV